MSKSSEAGLVTFERNGTAKRTGDLRYTLNPDVGDIELFGDNDQPVVVIPIGDGMVARKTMPRNVYVPSDGADDSVSEFTLRVTLDSIQRTEPKAKSGSGGADSDPILDRLIASGNQEAVEKYLVRTADGIGPKTAPDIAAALMDS